MTSTRRSLVQFFSFTYGLSWTCFVAAAAASRGAPAGSASSGFATALLVLGTFAPSLVALGLTARTNGRSGVRVLFERVLYWKVRARWYAFALSYMAAIKLGAALLYRVATGAWPPFGDEPWYVILAAIPLSTPVQAGEEIGWRGYALPRLAERAGFAPGSLILGLFWALWHLPLFFVPGIRNTGQSFPLFAIGNVGLSIALAWLYANTNGSLLLAMLMHSAVNQTIGIVPTRVLTPGNPFALDTSLVTLLADGVFLISVTYFFVRLRHIDLRAKDARRANRGPSLASHEPL